MSLAPVPLKKRLGVAAAVVGTLASFIAVESLVGHPARLVDLVGLFASAFAAGAGLVLAVRREP